MMKVTFKTNLGSRDAAEVHLDHDECTVGQTVEVKAVVAEWLAKRGIVEPLPEPKPAKAEKEIKAVPDKPAIAESKQATVVAKEEKKPSGKPGKTSKDKD